MKHEDYIRAIADEPELPGSMPLLMFETIKLLDQEGFEHWCRIIVQGTKLGILKRIDARLKAEQRGGNHNGH